jgi:uncharacterized protein YndB with AHSA1/START domain
MMLAEATIEIDADPMTVFDLFTTAAGLRQWMARDATIDLRPGGHWRWVHDDGAVCSGRYLEIDPPSRVLFTYGWEEGPFPDIAPGSTEVEVRFDGRNGGTTVVVEHRGLTDVNAERHSAGWAYFIGLLAQVAIGRPVVGERHPANGQPVADGPQSAHTKESPNDGEQRNP